MNDFFFNKLVKKMNTDLDFHKWKLSQYEETIKLTIKKNKWQIVYMFVCLLNSSLQSLNCYSNIVNNKYYFIQLIAAIIWLIAAFITYFGVIKKNKQIIKQNREYYNEELKIIDYPKWLKTQRTKKLQKIKKSLIKK
jgi:hypothetical protein